MKEFKLNENEKNVVRADCKAALAILDVNGNGIVMDPESIIAAIEKTVNDIANNNGRKTDILKNGNGKIDSSVECQALFPVLTCACHCAGCYAVNSCTKKFNGQGKQTAESWYKFTFIATYYPDIYFAQVDRELAKSKADECRWHVSGDFINNDDIARCIDTFSKYPHIRFYTYTKRNEKEMPALAQLKALANVNIVDSMPCGMINYGNDEYLANLARKVKLETGKTLVICKCGSETEKSFNKAHDKKNGGDGKKYCGGCCKACAYCEYVAFKQHK